MVDLLLGVKRTAQDLRRHETMLVSVAAHVGQGAPRAGEKRRSDGRGILIQIG